MMNRPLIIATLGSLLLSAAAQADRRRRPSRDDDSRRSIGRTQRAERERDADRDDRRDRAPAIASPGSAGARSDAERRGVSIDEDDDLIAPKKKARRSREDVAEAEDRDGPEASATYAVKLGDLIETAVRLSPELASSKTERAAARGQAGAARKDQSWILGAEASYAISAVSREVPVDLFGDVRTDTAKATLSLGRKLPTGGTFGVEVGMTRVGKEIAVTQDYIDLINQGQTPAQQAPGQDPNTGIRDYYTTHQSIAKLLYTQPLARGFGPGVALAQERRADLEYTAATVKTQLAAEEMILGIVTAYWELAYLGYEADVRAEALELATGQEKITKEQIRAGVAPSNANDAVTYEIAIRAEAKLAAELELEKKSLALRKRVGLELGRREIALRPGEPFEIGQQEWNADEVLDLARKSNRRLAAIGLQRRIADVDVGVAKNAMLPQVDVELSGGLVGTGRSQDEAFAAVGAADGYQLSAGLKISFELSGAAKSAHDAALARKARVEVERADASRSIDTDVVTAVKQVTSARARVGLADKAISVAESGVVSERQSFVAGRSDNYKVMQRQTELIEARLRRGQAVTQYHIAVAQLQRLSGMLLDQYHVNVRPNGK